MEKHKVLTVKPVYLISWVLLILMTRSISFATEVDIFQGRIDRLIYGDVYTTFGKSEAEIKSRMGAPLRIEASYIPNPHVKKTSDKHVKLIYDNLIIDLLRSGATGRELLVRVTLEDPKFVLGRGLRVGSKREDIEDYLGPPWKTDDSGGLIYGDDEGNSTVTFKLKEDRVTSITWSYYFD